MLHQRLAKGSNSSFSSIGLSCLKDLPGPLFLLLPIWCWAFISLLLLLFHPACTGPRGLIWPVSGKEMLLMSLLDQRRQVPPGVHGCGNSAIPNGCHSCLLKSSIQNLIYSLLSDPGSLPGIYILGDLGFKMTILPETTEIRKVICLYAKQFQTNISVLKFISLERQ